MLKQRRKRWSSVFHAKSVHNIQWPWCIHQSRKSQDWFHESCCNLRERPKSRENTPAALLEPSQLSNSQLTDIQDVDDAVSEASSSGLPPPLISGDEYESFICGACVSGNPTLRRWAGSYGLMMVVRDSVTDSWRILNGDSTDSKNLIQVENEYTSASSGDKRPLSPSALEPDAKRTKSLSDTSLLQSKSCLAPSQDSLARKILDDLGLSDSSPSLGAGDIFCTLNFRERWCHCDSVSIVSCVFSWSHVMSSLVFATSSSKSISSRRRRNLWTSRRSWFRSIYVWMNFIFTH